MHCELVWNAMQNGLPENPDFQALFNAAPGNYLVLDCGFRIEGVTDAYAMATNTVREIIVGKILFDVFPDNPDDPLVDGVRKLRAPLERVHANRRPDRMAIQKYDIPVIGDPTGVFEVRYWLPLNTAVSNDEGAVRYIIHSVEDVTDMAVLREDR